MNYFPLILLACALIISVVEDLRRMKIPNVVTFPTMALAIGFYTITGGFTGLGFSAAGLFLGIAFFLIPYFMGGMGAGDAKLMGAAGAVLGPQGICTASFYVILAGGIYGLVLLALHPTHLLSFFKRSGAMVRTFVLTGQFILMPADTTQAPPVLRFAVPIALGCAFHVYLTITGSHLL